MLNVILIDNNRVYTFSNVSKLNANQRETTIGYFDDENVYHEETNDTPTGIFVSNNSNK